MYASTSSIFCAYVKFLKGRLELYMFSDKLPPLLSTRRNAREVFNILSRIYGYSIEDGVKTIVINPLHVPAVVTWVTASISTPPSVELLEKLIECTPKTALQLIFESIDSVRAYIENKPMIPNSKLARVSRKVTRILGLGGGEETHRGVLC